MSNLVRCLISAFVGAAITFSFVNLVDVGAGCSCKPVCKCHDCKCNCGCANCKCNHSH